MSPSKRNRLATRARLNQTIPRGVPAPTAPTTPGQNPALRPATIAAAPGQVRRARRTSMTGAQRDTNGNRSDWSKPQNLRPGTTPMMPAWSATVSNRPVATADVSMRGTGTSRTR